MSRPPITPEPRAAALSIVVPMFNEERNVEATVEEIRSKIGPRVDVWEAILVDDGSLDDTAAVAEALAADDRRVRVVRHPGNRGYGAALRSGFAAAAYPLVFYTDGDLQFDLAEIDRLLALVDGADIVTGYRIDRQDPWHRRFNASFYNATMRLLFGVRVKDLDCAFKIYRKSIFETIAPRSDGILISGEILVEATRQGLVIREVGVTHHPRRAGVATGNKPLVVMAAMLELARFCKRQLLRPASSTSAERRRRGTTR